MLPPTNNAEFEIKIGPKAKSLAIDTYVLYTSCYTTDEVQPKRCN